MSKMDAFAGLTFQVTFYIFEVIIRDISTEYKLGKVHRS